MAKSSADDGELRRACEAAIEGTKQKITLSIRVAKSRGIWGKSAKLGRGHMAKARVLAISTKAKEQRTKAFLRVLKYSTGGVLEDGSMYSALDYCKEFVTKIKGKGSKGYWDYGKTARTSYEKRGEVIRGLVDAFRTRIRKCKRLGEMSMLHVRRTTFFS